MGGRRALAPVYHPFFGHISFKCIALKRINRGIKLPIQKTILQDGLFLIPYELSRWILFLTGLRYSKVEINSFIVG